MVRSGYGELQPVDVEDALRIQNRLIALQRSGKKIDPLEITLVAGADAAYAGTEGCGAVAVFTYPEMIPVQEAGVILPVAFPYIPGLFAFREGPLIAGVLGQLDPKPDILMIDGHGYSHPRRFGLATHMGIITGIPTIGIAKDLLCGSANVPSWQRGSTSPVISRGEVIGMAVRTRSGSRPVYVSSGYRSDLSLAVDMVLWATKHSRLPFPVRAAHILAGLKCREGKIKRQLNTGLRE